MAQISVNFEGVESGGGQVHIPEGDYAFKIMKVVQKNGKDSGNPYLNFSLKVTQGDAAGLNKVLPHICTLTKNSLWNLRNLLEATGKTVPAKALKIDLDKLVGLGLAGTVVDGDEYKGRKKSVVATFFPVSDLGKAEDSDSEGDGDEEGTESESESEEATDDGEEIFE